MKGRPFVLLGVNSDADREKLKSVLMEKELTWRSFWNGGSTSGPISTKWAVEGWPSLYVIDHKGIIRHVYLGSPGDEELDKVIDRLVKEAETAATATPK